MMKTKCFKREYAMKVACLLMILLVLQVVQAREISLQHDVVIRNGMDPEQVLGKYLHAIYSRDARAAYALLSDDDKNTKSYNEYRQETAGFDGDALSLAYALSAGIKFKNTKTDVRRNRAQIRFDVSLPNASDPQLRARLFEFNNRKLAALSDDQLKRLIDDIRAKAIDGQLPSLESVGENWNLVLENGTWRIFENWADAVRITFAGQTFDNLGWEFVPMQEELMAKHGETLHMKYLARNLGANETTGKARHIIGPDPGSDYLELVSCFCFLEQTLAPGEAVEMPLVFRVNYDAPDDLEHISLKYEFYPIEMFPDQAKYAGGQASLDGNK